MKHKFLAAALGISLFCNLSLQAMHIDRVIVSSDANKKYLDFWPLVAKMWKQVTGIRPTLALVADESVQVDETLGDVIRFTPIPGVPTSLQAQTIRLLLPAYMYPDDVCLISDIDLIPLSEYYFKNSLATIANDQFVVFRNGAKGLEDEKTSGWLMCYIAARGKTYGDVFNVRTEQQTREKIQEWYDLKLGWYTDQLVMKKELMAWSKYQTRCTKLGHKETRRVDRSDWKYKPAKVKRGYYIDSHMPRPYDDYKGYIDQLVSFIPNNYGIKTKQPMAINRQLGDPNYGTHMTPLITAVMNTKGPVLEMGSGDFSTPLLHAVCSAQDRFLLTTDSDRKWLGFFLDLASDNHQFMYVPVYDDDWEKNPKPRLWDQVGNDRHWGVVFIDHRPGERRRIDIARMKSKADIIVVHDTEQPTYGYEPFLKLFKYRYTYKRYSTYTTLLSDTIDVAALFEK